MPLEACPRLPAGLSDDVLVVTRASRAASQRPAFETRSSDEFESPEENSGIE
jgi:hypothetical protein